MKTYVEVWLREGYVQTNIAFYKNNGSFKGFCTSNTNAPLELFSCENEAEMLNIFDLTLEDLKDDDIKKVFPGLKYTLNLKLEFVTRTFNIREARIITPLRGGKDVSSMFDFTFKDRMLKNMFTQIGLRDVEKLNTILKALLDV